jgi:hypothetical protein
MIPETITAQLRNKLGPIQTLVDLVELYYNEESLRENIIKYLENKDFVNNVTTSLSDIKNFLITIDKFIYIKL